MSEQKNVKEIVKEKYAEIAVSSARKCCCGSSNNKVVDYTIMKDNYENLDGYVAEADLGLGCGLPTEFAEIKKGDTVVDLGSGAGNDVFVARALVGNEGKVIGIDFTDEMIIKANLNLDKLGYRNVEFKYGEIEDLPIDDNFADVVVSNCVLNLVPDKQKAFNEIFRVLKPGAHFCVSDIVIKGELHPELKQSAEMYAGCVAGAVQQEEYLDIIRESGFKNVEIKKSKTIELPDEVLSKYLNKEQIKEYKEKQTDIYSITVVGYKFLNPK
ncbi:MAG: arsenite S-adenosylmethyltransferase [Ignavibacteriales bacterium UTCHB2]|nr:MAG: Demethylrebeccamycin-D-glucose O-methyltransferase [Ignavibacteria bacterium ADurb.Bin266]OQY71707.1 MAG: arsenite S-adenosylmethyltransferase [Ignavibacteriales bacterium UTCHB2]HQI41936.1 arsenite methyltransferase [Ignavibacteriaceae bacterium]HQJ45412.1 arsenite methyltransferase [Ignavibacteriaceae bacterium]